MPLMAARFVTPCKVPLPALRLALTTVVLSPLRRFPNWSSIRIKGCWTKITPAVAVLEGCDWMVSLLAAAALTTTLEEKAGRRDEALKLSVMVSAVLYERLVKVTMPPLAIKFVAPCKALL